MPGGTDGSSSGGVGGGGGAHGGRGRGGVNLNDFNLLKVIGKGSFGRVLLVRQKATGRLYAMKMLSKRAIIKRKQVEHTHTERRVLASTSHPNIVGLHFAFQSRTQVYLVIDYCAGGELFFHIGRLGRFRESMARFYAAQIALALGHLHSKGIVYRDLKPENVLLDARGDIKLADFGLSKEGITDGVEGTRSFCGTPEYLAPEILDRKGHGTAVDWWSLGMLLFEMLSGLPPWYTRDRKQLYERIRGAELEFPAYLRRSSVSLLQGLLTRDPARRLGAVGDLAELQAHPFFESIDWLALLERRITPPFVPVLDDKTDTRYFEETFTATTVADRYGSVSSSAGTDAFPGFSFVADNPLDAVGTSETDGASTGEE